MGKAKKASTGRVLVHFILGLLTGGLWWLWLVVRFLVNNR